MSSTVEVGRALALPAGDVGEALNAVHEDQWFDRKSFRIAARELGNVLVGFANADGGTIVVGLHDGVVEGTDRSITHRNELMQAHVQFCQPAVPAHSSLIACRRHDGEPDHLLAIEVRSGEAIYTNARDEVFLRIGDENRRLTFAQRQELLYDRGQGTYESRELAGASLAELDRGLLDDYARAVDAPDAIRLLRARGLAVDDTLTVAGVLLFARHPQRYLPESFVRVLRYQGRERGTGTRQQLIRDERIEGPIARQLIAAREVVRGEQPRRRALTERGTFGDVMLIPEDAWLEGIVNAVIHRSYSLAGDHIRVEIFSDRIEITSPGRFPALFDANDPLGAPRYARNPRIARVCADQNFGQELGEGIRRMFDEMRLAGLADPLYEETPGSVRLTLLTEPVDRELEARLPRGARAIMATLRGAGQLSTGEVSELVGISRPTASKHLRVLRDAGLIEWTGKSPRDPRASWSLPKS
jgi:ATP-dependent DNA helicase RecG